MEAEHMEKQIEKLQLEINALKTELGSTKESLKRIENELIQKKLISPPRRVFPPHLTKM